ncbi:MAG TPA: CBS domain-containing protein [Streptosporangiaceae bacterium]|jgi:CBS-domain-containing membrane protein|nr:CBS domain-containing protein [Streptosporangiaceae bacterium]
MSTTVRDVMTTHVVAVTEDASFKDVAVMLRQHQVSSFPVVDADGKVIGVVTEGDMLPKEALLAVPGSRVPSGESRPNDFAKADGVTAASIMTGAPITITPDEPVTSAARLMYSCKVKSLPVVTGTGHLAGIISRADVLSVYSRPAAEIEREIRQEVIRAEFHSDPDRFTVTVKDGIVTLQGHPDTAQQARAILAQAWHVEGVVSVRDRLTYPEGSPSHV